MLREVFVSVLSSMYIGKQIEHFNVNVLQKSVALGKVKSTSLILEYLLLYFRLSALIDIYSYATKPTNGYRIYDAVLWHMQRR